MGGAVAVAHRRALDERGDPLLFALTARRQMESNEAEVLSQVASGKVWQLGVMTLLRAAAVARQQSLDEIAVTRIFNPTSDN